MSGNGKPDPKGRQNSKWLSGEEAGAEGWVDAGSEAFASEGAARFIGLKNVVGGVADDGEIQRRSVFSGSAAVFFESQSIVQCRLFSMPQCAHCGEDSREVT